MGRATTPVAVLYPRGRRAGTQSDEAHVGPYELIGEIGRGGMGTVYLAGRAGHAGFRRLSALKLMHRHLAEDLDFLSMFLDEARIAARIHHANVVSILDLDASSRGYFVVMDYVEGCSLAQLLARSASYRSPRVLSRVVVDFLLGLHAAHSLRDECDRPLELVHRDVSPANVLIGVDGVARITDFGVAKARARIATTQPGIHKGTLSYASPEQLRSPRLVDARTDIWATGVLLWNSLTGRSLFRGDSDAQTVHRILKRKVPPPSRIGLEPPPFLDEVCLRALDRDPCKRFGSADEMADALYEAATRHDVLGTQRELGACVAESFSLEFAARRKAIRDAERMHGEHSPQLLMTELAELSTPVHEGVIASGAARDADRAVGASSLPAGEVRAEGSGVHRVWPHADAEESADDYEEVYVEFVQAGAPAVMSESSAAELAPRPRRLGRALRLAMVGALIVGATSGAITYRGWDEGDPGRVVAEVSAVARASRAIAHRKDEAPGLPWAMPPVTRDPARANPPAAREPASELQKPSRPRAARASRKPSPAPRRDRAPDQYQTHLAAALQAQRQGRLQDALASIDLAVAARRTGRAFQVKADILMQQGAAAAALDAANKAVALAPQSGRAWLTKGMLHYELRQYADAKTALERNLRISPNGRDADTIRLIVEEL